MLQLLDDKNESLDCTYQHFKCAKPLDFSFKNLITLEGMYIVYWDEAKPLYLLFCTFSTTNSEDA